MDDRLVANQANWNDRTALHLRSRYYDVEGWLRERRGPAPHEVELLGDVSGLRLLHLQCHFGLDTLAWARAGAIVTGLDFSPSAVAAARELAERSGLDERATFVCADVHDASTALNHSTFDIVYVSLGALCWLPRVDPWAAQVGSLVARGGRFYIYEGHPLAWSMAGDRPMIVRTYFEEPEPLVGDSGETYTDVDGPVRNQRSYEWNHGIGEIVTALVRHGLRIERLDEHDWTNWPASAWLVQRDDGRWGPPSQGPRLPLTFTLLASKPSCARAAARGA